MRILIATDHFPPFIGGAHRQAHLLATSMAERGHEIAVATTWHGGLPALERSEGFECVAFGSSARPSGSWFATKNNATILRFRTRSPSSACEG